MPRWLPAVFCLLAVLAASVFILSREAPAVVGSNGIAPAEFVSRVAPGERVCQPAPPTSRPVVSVRVTAAAAGVLAYSLRTEGSRMSTVSSVNGVIELPASGPFGSDVCITNTGYQPVLLAGQPIPSSTIGGKAKKYTVSIQFMGHRGHWSRLVRPTLARIGFGRGELTGAGSSIVIMVLLAAAIGIAVRSLDPSDR